MATDFGTDLSALPVFGVVSKSGLPNLTEALYRRLITPRGGLFYDLDYGTDICQYLNETWSDDIKFELESLIPREWEKDPRVLEATVEAEFQWPDTINLYGWVETEAGPFDVVLTISRITLETQIIAPVESVWLLESGNGLWLWESSTAIALEG